MRMILVMLTCFFSFAAGAADLDFNSKERLSARKQFSIDVVHEREVQRKQNAIAHERFMADCAEQEDHDWAVVAIDYPKISEQEFRANWVRNSGMPLIAQMCLSAGFTP